MPEDTEGQRGLDLLELVVPTLSHHVVLGTKLWPSVKAARALNYQAISLAPYLIPFNNLVDESFTVCTFLHMASIPHSKTSDSGGFQVWDFQIRTINLHLEQHSAVYLAVPVPCGSYSLVHRISIFHIISVFSITSHCGSKSPWARWMAGQEGS